MMNGWELYHHGVKGMRWGIIRWKSKLGYGRLSRKASKYDKKIAKLDSKRERGSEKYARYVGKRNAIQSQMSRKYSLLSNDEKESGRKAYKRLIVGAKIAGLLVGDLVMKKLYDNLERKNTVATKVAMAINKSDIDEFRNAIEIGKYVVESPRLTTNRDVTALQSNKLGNLMPTYFMENGQK